ncbi:MAG TPA: hypothetical protein VFE62_09035 [Gemmataceae bacterium]|nr:hypothetical protein [Gemmataceae bacterium]
METLQTTPIAQMTVRCQIAAHALLRAPADVIAQWRRQPIEHDGEKMSASFLKHAEDQTVAGVTAVLQACAQQEWRHRSFAEWGVIAAPNLFGRINNDRAINQYRKEGAWGISPHLIPQQSLHALSGSVSQFLKLHGPNFGVSGGPNAGPDAMLIAAAMLADGALPGLWVVLTGHESEWIPQADGSLPPAPACLAAALALTPPDRDETGPHVVFGHAAPADLAILPDFHLALFAEEWQTSTSARAGRWRLSDTLWIDFDSER